MKKIYIKDIRERDQVLDTFIVTRKETGVSKAGKSYLILRLMDSSGEAEARAWENAEQLSAAFEKDDVVRVKGYAVSYQGGLQINVTGVEKIAEGEYSLRDYLPSSKRPPEEMIEELDSIVSGMRDANIRALLQAILNDPDVRKRFMAAPAAKLMHHPYLGGLLEHVLSICGLVDRVSEHYGEAVNRDLLIAGAVLHDIGKIYELSYERSFDYTDEGKLIGHITMGVGLVDEKLKSIEGFPKELGVLLKHMLLSHHGQLEFGSPKRPKTLEAIVLSYLDDLDAKVNAVLSATSGDAQGMGNWTPYQRIFERPLYRGERFFSEEPPSTPEEDAPGVAGVREEGPAGEGTRKERGGKSEKEKVSEPDLFGSTFK